MQLKDYYLILNIPPSASPDEIKKAYRKLALQYHPDKTGNDPYAVAQFTQIKEAYETLTHPAKKNQYLQQRWYAQSMNKRMTQDAITPVSILKQLLELDKYTSRLDIHRMDHEGLYQHLCYVLSDETIQTINSFNETDVNNEIVLTALKSGRLLPYPLAVNFAGRLEKIKSTGIIPELIKDYTLQLKENYYWEKRRVWIVVIVVVILCAVIFLWS